jgi:hypothetical protein
MTARSLRQRSAVGSMLSAVGTGGGGGGGGGGMLMGSRRMASNQTPGPAALVRLLRRTTLPLPWLRSNSPSVAHRPTLACWLMVRVAVPPAWTMV